MKNRKLVKASLAGALALGLVAGGTTFAAWSDFTTYDNSAGAEYLTLDVNNDRTQGFSQEMMAPGLNREFEFVVASREGQVVPNAALTLKLENLVGSEDGCQGNSEGIADAGACEDDTTSGQYADEVRINVNVSKPTTDLANACSSSMYPRGGKVTPMSLRQLETKGITNLLPAGVNLKPGEGICIGMGLELPTSATNASQGDSATWDFRYDLTQVLP